MATTSEHLEKLHKAASRFHRTMAEAHGAVMEKETKGSHAHTFHKTAHGAHSEAADTHDALLDECQKVIAASDLEKGNRIVPDRVSGISRTAPPEAYGGYRAIPRAGQPEPEIFAQVSPELRSILGSPDGDDDF